MKLLANPKDKGGRSREVTCKEETFRACAHFEEG